jgi:hypothetical protein
METKKRKTPPEYAMLQLDKNIHDALKVYCKEHGFMLKGFVQALIRQALSNNKKK